MEEHIFNVGSLVDIITALGIFIGGSGFYKLMNRYFIFRKDILNGEELTQKIVSLEDACTNKDKVIVEMKEKITELTIEVNRLNIIISSLTAAVNSNLKGEKLSDFITTISNDVKALP